VAKSPVAGLFACCPAPKPLILLEKIAGERLQYGHKALLLLPRLKNPGNFYVIQHY
jgi:hypothetical protein